MNPTLPVHVYYADDDDDNVGDKSTGRIVASSSSIIRNRSLGNNIGGSSTTNNIDQFTAPAPTQHQQAPKSGHIPSPTNGVRSLSDDGVNQRILASPLLRHRHHPNRRQTSSGSMTPNSRMQHRRLQQQQQQQWNPQIQGSHSLDDADIAAGAAQLRAMELLSSPPQSLHHPSSGSSNNAWRSSPSSRSLGSQTPTNFFARQSKYYSGGEIELTRPLVAQKLERGGGGGDHHYLYGGSEHDFLALSPDGEENDDDLDYEDRQYLLQQQPLSSNHIQYPPYGLQSIEDSPDIVAINSRRQKMQFTSSSSSSVDDNKDSEYFTALLPPKPPLYSSSDDGTATSQSNATATTTATHSNTTTTTTPPTAKFAVLGWDLTTYSRRTQFLISAGGTFVFSLIYGYLQELISVTLCNRKLGLFLALAQFTGYTILSYFFRRLDMSGGGSGPSAGIGGVMGGETTFFSRKFRRLNNWGKLRGGGPSASTSSSSDPSTTLKKSIPIELYIGLSVLRAIDLGMTNLAMQYVNYPAKTIMKSTR